jgi:hypothetical protein
MAHDPKKIGALIVAGMGKPSATPADPAAPEGPEEQDGDGGDEEGRVHAASEMMEALKQNDSAAFAAALHAFIQMC